MNALAVPGGFIYVFKGLVDLMPDDDELAGVIGHEVGHVVKRHSEADGKPGDGACFSASYSVIVGAAAELGVSGVNGRL